MASQEAAPSAPIDTPPAPTTTGIDESTTTTKPVEMSTLPPSAPEQAPESTEQTAPTQASPATAEDANAASSSALEPAPASTSQQPTDGPTLTRMQSEALGPATEGVISPPATVIGQTLSITLQLVTGARHPYKIDQKYLNSRKVEALTADGQFDPRELSGYKLKELIWTDWRSEWEPKPASPSSIRLIRSGRFIDDKKPLSDYNVSFDESNFIQMTVKPADFTEDDETAGGKPGKGSSIRQRDGPDTGAGCRCVIL